MSSSSDRSLEGVILGKFKAVKFSVPGHLQPNSETLFTPAASCLSRAYRICLDVERAATNDQDTINARVLGYLIIHAPSAMARSEVITAIVSCQESHDRLFDLGSFIVHVRSRSNSCFLRGKFKSKNTKAEHLLHHRMSLDRPATERKTRFRRC